MKKWWVWVLVLIIVVVLAATIYWLFFKGSNKESMPSVTSTPLATQSASPSATTQDNKPSQTTNTENIKTPHFVSSAPEAGAVLTATVSKVTITFNFDLATGSKITVTGDGNLVNTPEPTKIASDKLSMSQTINPIEPATYKVAYTACWPDGSCHNGSFGYTVK